MPTPIPDKAYGLFGAEMMGVIFALMPDVMTQYKMVERKQVSANLAPGQSATPLNRTDGGLFVITSISFYRRSGTDITQPMGVNMSIFTNGGSTGFTISAVSPDSSLAGHEFLQEPIFSKDAIKVTMTPYGQGGGGQLTYVRFT